MPRLLFEKNGRAIWISHLDLMRLFQRAFKRAGLSLKHTQGYNPRPSVSIALPLSVGITSCCELLDFDLEGEYTSCEEIKDRLNSSLIEGVHVLNVYEEGKKLRDLSLLHCNIHLEYDNGVPEGAASRIHDLLHQNELIVTKRTKNGMQEQNIIPLIRWLKSEILNENEILLDCMICCQNPTLNPILIVTAIERYLPEDMPNFSKCSRLEIFDQNENVFR